MPGLHFAIPAFNERHWLPGTLASLAQQDDLDFSVTVCVNQPDNFALDPANHPVHEENVALLTWLKAHQSTWPFELEILDAVTPEAAPPAAKAGVGWARDTLFRHLTAKHGPAAIYVSLDADTRVPPSYSAAIRAAFSRYPNAVGLAAPYYHHLPDSAQQARHLLRYEIYMRYYQTQLWRIGSPYAFLPLGSAIAFRGQAYRKTRGFPHRQAGEDFYFLQQLRKTGPLIRWLPCAVEPAARRSSRVPFGTGTVLQEDDLSLQAQRFPFYARESFERIGETYRLWQAFHKQPVNFPIHDFLVTRFKGYQRFTNMRRNHRQLDRFLRACHENFDALRILQCLRHYQSVDIPVRHPLQNLWQQCGGVGAPCFETGSLHALQKLRNQLFQRESAWQEEFMAQWDHQTTW